MFESFGEKFYHLTPKLVYENNIKKEGLKITNQYHGITTKGERPERIYLFKPLKENVMNRAFKNYIISRDKSFFCANFHKKDLNIIKTLFEYSVLEINISNLDLHIDDKYQQGLFNTEAYYTNRNIPKENIKEIDIIINKNKHFITYILFEHFLYINGYDKILFNEFDKTGLDDSHYNKRDNVININAYLFDLPPNCSDNIKLALKTNKYEYHLNYFYKIRRQSGNESELRKYLDVYYKYFLEFRKWYKINII